MIAKKMNAIVGFCWVYAILWNIPTFSLRRYNDKTGRCFLEWPISHLGKARAVYWVINTAVVPVIIMGYLYIQIVRKLWATVQPGSPSYERARYEKSTLCLNVKDLILACKLFLVLGQFNKHSAVAKYRNLASM